MPQCSSGKLGLSQSCLNLGQRTWLADIHSQGSPSVRLVIGYHHIFFARVSVSFLDIRTNKITCMGQLQPLVLPKLAVLHFVNGAIQTI